MPNPSGMNASLKEAAKPTAPYLPAPTVALTIRSKGYEWQLRNAKKQRLHFKEEIYPCSRQLQIGCCVYVCFNNEARE